MQSIVVYCGSNSGKKEIYSQTAYALGKELANRNIKLIYGGGNMGLMGRVADGSLEHGGLVTGIIPNFLARLEVSLSGGVIALPGGYGTFDELFEILTWAQLEIFDGPVGILNINGYYDLLLLQLDKMVEEGFLNEDNRKLLIVSDNIVDLLDKMEASKLARPGNKPLN
jgi:predicted Rossmann-fold nucleotide-binding protein